MSMLPGLPTPNVDTTLTAPAVVPQAVNGYITLPVTADPLQLTADAFAFIAEQIPGWIPREGHLEAIIVEAWARMVSETANTAAQVPVAAFMFFGGLVGIIPNSGAAATASTTWTVVNANGYTIPAGTTVAYTTASNAQILFQTVAAVTVPTGQVQTQPGQVTIQAVAIGAAGDGFIPQTLTLIDQLSFVGQVVSTTTTSGGADAETVATYINRLSNELQLLTPRPILAGNFSALATNVAGVYRAVTVDNWNGLGNQLTAVDSSFETGIGTAAEVLNCTLSDSTTWSLNGSKSLRIASIAGGAMTAEIGPYPVSANTQYTWSFQAHTATTVQTVTAAIRWQTPLGVDISTSSGTGVSDTTSGGALVSCTATSPSTAGLAYFQFAYTNTGGASELHYVDEASFNLGTSTTWGVGGAQGGQMRMVTVVPVDIDGNPLSSLLMTALQTYLDGLRETNFVVTVIPPTYTAVAVVAQVVAQPTASATAVQAAVEAALNMYLSPATWAGGSNQPPQWLADFTVFYLNVAAVIGNVPGVQSITTLTLNGGTSDVALVGTAALPLPTVSVNVTAGTIGT